MTDSAVYYFDFTLSAKFLDDFDSFLEFVASISELYCFQLEQGKQEGYEHFQGRIKTKKRVRLQTLINTFHRNNFPVHLSRTSTNGKGTMSYVMKEDTRIDGPWADDMSKIKVSENANYIPRQIREIHDLYPWQQYIVDNIDVWDTRTINCIVDKKGNNGKTILKGFVRAHKLATPLPYFNDYRDLMRCAMCLPIARCYLFDLPRAMPKDRLHQFYSGVESLKDGVMFDDRYHYKERFIDCPNIWVFTNKDVDTSYLSLDRWKFWRISSKLKLKVYKPPKESDDKKEEEHPLHLPSKVIDHSDNDSDTEEIIVVQTY